MALNKKYIRIPDTVLGSLQDRCRGIGVDIYVADEERRILWPPLHADTLSRVDRTPSPSPAESAATRAQVASVASSLAEHEFEAPFALDPLRTVVPVPVLDRRRRVGTILAIVTTRACGGPEGVLASEAPHLPPALAGMIIADWLADLRQIQANEVEMATLSQQLCNTYEEINLLHNVGQGMDVVRHPRRFLQLVCQELLEVLPFRWIAVRLVPGTDLSSLVGDLFVAEGLPEEQQDRVCAVITSFLADFDQGGPLIVNGPGRQALPPAMESLGNSILIHPLARGNAVYGAVVAVDKQGIDPLINSVDANLIDTTVASVKVFLDNAALYQDQHRMFLGTLEALTASIDAKDAYTCGHSRRVALLSQKIGAAAGLEEERVRRVHIAGLVHDVGKIGIPESVLCKPGRLTDDEFEIIKTHPDIGARILRDIPHFEDIIPGVLHHHERFDGKGYPARLAGKDIPEFGRIIAVADSFDAMSSTRTYRSALHRARVLEEMKRCAGTQFDPVLIESFLSLDLDDYDEMYDWDRTSIVANQTKQSKAA